MRHHFFITGTDSGVGKTVLSALLCAALDAVYWKPIQTGTLEGSDRVTVMRLAGIGTDRTLDEVYKQANAQSVPSSRLVVVHADLGRVEWAGTCELENESIDPGDVIGQKQEAAFRQIFEAERVDAIKNFDERPARKMERALTGGHVRHRLFVYN